MPKGSQAPQVTATEVNQGSIQLLGYDATAPAGENFKRIPKSELQDAIAPVNKWQKITTFLNTWVNMAGQPELAICKLPSGQILIDGTISGGALDTGDFQTPAFTVPVGYRPVTEPFWVFPVVGNLAVSPIPQGVTVIFPNGNVHILAPSNAAIVFPCRGDRSFF